MELRKHERHKHRFSTEIKISGKEGSGHIVDWSAKGIQVFSTILPKPDISYRVCFCIEKNLFGDHSEFVDQMWVYKGVIVWITPYEDGSKIGINFEEELHFPVNQLKDYFTTEDHGIITIFPEKKETQPEREGEKEDLSSGNQVFANDTTIFSVKSYTNMQWTLWGALIVLEMMLIGLFIR
ncbi:MAG: PilZ domain-containing protein [SAR324 cluster bacterium]|nr:PilZ domain-containing protein [SAR324 cluster bacterium]